MKITTNVEPTLLHEVHRIDHRHLRRIALFALLYAAGAAGALHVEPWWARAPFWLLAAASLHGISLFTHEGVHDALSARPLWNRLLAAACALPVLQNFAAYRVLHLEHHDDTGGERDPDDYRNYTSRGWLVFVMHWLRLLIGYPVYIVMIPILAWRRRKDRLGIALEVLALAAVATAVALLVPLRAIVECWAIPMLLINFMVNVRGMSQHTLLPEAKHEIRGTRTILANPVVTFFMCNENFHLEHHLYPKVPWYNLPRLHRAIRDELVAQGAPFIPSYLAFVRVFLGESFALLRSAA